MFKYFYLSLKKYNQLNFVLGVFNEKVRPLFFNENAAPERVQTTLKKEKRVNTYYEGSYV